jgi:hypothetical protein
MADPSRAPPAPAPDLEAQSASTAPAPHAAPTRRRTPQQQQPERRTPDDAVVATVDGEPFSAERARSLARNVWIAGFAFLPLAWAANCWLWWPHAKGGPGTDPVVRMC